MSRGMTTLILWITFDCVNCRMRSSPHYSCQHRFIGFDHIVLLIRLSEPLLWHWISRYTAVREAEAMPA